MKFTLEERFLRGDLRGVFQQCGLNSCLYYHKLFFTSNCGPIEFCPTDRNFSIRLYRISPHFQQTTSDRYPPETVLAANAFETLTSFEFFFRLYQESCLPQIGIIP